MDHEKKHNKKEKKHTNNMKKVHVTVYVCVWVSGCLCGCVVQGVGVVCWRVGVWVSVFFFLKKCFLCVCVFFLIRFFKSLKKF